VDAMSAERFIIVVVSLLACALTTQKKKLFYDYSTRGAADFGEPSFLSLGSRPKASQREREKRASASFIEESQPLLWLPSAQVSSSHQTVDTAKGTRL